MESTLTCRISRVDAHELRASPGSATARADQTTVRRANLGVVLQQIAAGEPRSRASVAAETGLTRGTVSSLVGELIELDLLRETGEDEHSGRVGRPAQTLELGDRVVSIGLEVNVDYLAVCVEDLTGTIRYERRVHTDNRRSSPRPVLESARPDGERGARRRVGAAGSFPAGVAVALPGLVEAQTGTLLWAPNLGWSEIPVADEIAARLPGLRSRRARRERVEPRGARRALAGRRARRSRTSSASSARSASAAASSSTASSSAAPTASAASSATSPSIRPGRPASAAAAGCLETFVGLEAIAQAGGHRRSAPAAARAASPRSSSGAPRTVTRP